MPYAPRSHPFVERLIRICRDEILDHSFFWTESDLQAKLDEFQGYFNELTEEQILSLLDTEVVYSFPTTAYEDNGSTLDLDWASAWEKATRAVSFPLHRL